jgi:beta-N-acetylhexosaminidase
MRPRYASVCLTLLVLNLGALGCFGVTSDHASDPASGQETTTTAAPTTTTTLSAAQVTLSTMTVRQKAAQVLLLAFSGTSLSAETSALLAAGPPGGLIVLGYNVTDAAQVRALTAALQQAAAADGSRVGLLVAVDQEGGDVRRIRQGVPSLPSARKLGTSSNPNEASELARQTAHGLLDMGINMNFAPVADVVADKKSFLFDRSYGDDSALVSSFVTAVIQASQGQGLISVVKHFPGHGSASGDTHEVAATSTATKQEFERVHLPPFRAAISVGVEGVMISHIVATAFDAQNPASLSPAVVGSLLREDLGFEGLVVADDLFMAAALDSGTETASQAASAQQGSQQAKIAAEAKAAVAAINAGCDLLILSEREANSMAVLEALVAAIERGDVSQSRLDDAVLRILDVKFRHGIVARQNSSPTTSLSQEETIR